MIPKIFKISGYLIDPTGRLEPHHIKAKMLYGCGFPLVGQHIHVQKAEIKKLNEKHPLMREKGYFLGWHSVKSWPIRIFNIWQQHC